MPVLKIEVHPDVYSELELSRAWYEEKATNLGTEFLNEIERALKVIQEAPTMWSWYDKEQDVRRFLVHRFPYAILYRTTSTAIQIIAAMHLRRNPDYWKSRKMPE
jgi:plasmid stabilization system protein ParE